MVWVKICANTNLEDALQAVEAGADAVGFVFASSRRQMTPEQVGPISARLPPGVERVGVFPAQQESVEALVGAVEVAGLTAVQLHGGLDLRFAAELRAALGPEVALIHTVHWSVDQHAAAEQVWEAFGQAESLPGEERLLIDAKVGRSSGGLGVAYDWEAAAKVLRGAPGVRVIVAGGLRPESVAEAVRVIRPYGVDVASGVEREPGVKDHAKVTAFIKNARSAG